MKPHKQRKAESNLSPKLVEHLQAGILVRFNITEVQREDTAVFEYDEFWFDLDETNIADIVSGLGFELTPEHINLLMN